MLTWRQSNQSRINEIAKIAFNGNVSTVYYKIYKRSEQIGKVYLEGRLNNYQKKMGNFKLTRLDLIENNFYLRKYFDQAINELYTHYVINKSHEVDDEGLM